jgi:DNA-binding transcriptional MerR regulator
MNDQEIIHVLRNITGYSIEQIKQAMAAAADRLERAAQAQPAEQAQ